VKQASEDDPDKVFGPRTEGIVLGVYYDTIEWVWFLQKDKLSIILNKVEDAIEKEEMVQRAVKSLTGKLVDIRCLVPNSKFYLSNLIIDAHQTKELESMVEVSEWIRRDLAWWKVILPLCSKRTRLQDPDRRFLSSAFKIYSEVAGGSMETLGNWVGMAIFLYNYAYIPHGTKISAGFLAYDGKSLANKFSVWEVVTLLQALVCVVDMLGGRQAIAFMDNAGRII
jgi:hypothetical protein